MTESLPPATGQPSPLPQPSGSAKKVIVKKKRKTRKGVPVNQPFHWFEGSVTHLHSSSTNDDENITQDSVTEEEFAIEYDKYDEYDDFDINTVKCGGGRTSPSSMAKKLSLLNHNLVRKESKKEEKLSENRTKQKTNIANSLQKRGLERFGFEIYQRRSEAHKATKNTHQTRGGFEKPQDPPSVLKYELRNDRIPKGQDYLSSLIDLQHRELTPEDYELLLLLDNSVAPKTVSSSVLEKIPSLTIEKLGLSLSEVCSICMEQYESNVLVKKLACEHVFHSSCIDHWLLNSSQNCPLDGLAIS